MALSTYTELKASIADYLNRSDLTTAIPDFISLTEAKLKRRYKDFSPLSASNANNWILTSYPDVYLYGALLEASPYLVEDQRVDVWAQLYAAAVGTLRGTVGNADFDDYDGLKLAVGDWLARADLDGVVPQLIKLGEAKLFRKFDGVTALTSSNTTNWILTNHPDLYLYASLSEAAPYLGQDDRLQVWRTLYEAEVGRIRKPKSGVNLDDYDGLKAAIADWLERYDLDDAIPDFIQLAEARIKRRVRDITPLTAAETTNWMLTNHPDVYLFGSLVEAIPYVGNDERIPLWQAKYDAALAEVRRPDADTSLADYAGLKAAIADWLNRPDIDEIIPEFIQLAEARIKRRVRDITALSDGNTTNWVLTNHPDVYLFGSLSESAPYLGQDERVVLWQAKYDAAFAEVRRPDTDSGLADYAGLKFTIADWLNRPDIDDAIPEFIALAEARIKRRVRDVDALSVSNTTNWILTNHPDVYLFGALAEAAPYLGNDERTALWQTKYEAAFAEVRRPDADSGLSDYAGLKFAVSDWLNRPDLDETVPEFIRLAEARLQRRFKDVTTLSTGNTTNWMLTNHPDVYLHGALAEAAPYLGDDQRVLVWQGKYESALLEVRRPNTSTSLDTYTGLKLAIADWLDRPDLDDIIPQFIEMAEAQMSRDIRHFEMENRATADVDGQYLQRPSDWVETIRLHITSGGTRNLQLLSAAAMADKRQGVENATGEPKYYRHVERGFEVFPTADGTYEVELLYYQKIPALTASNADNWLLLSHPDVYLYGALIHAAPYIKDDQRAATWAQLYSAALARVNESGSSASQSGTGLTLKVRGLG